MLPALLMSEKYQIRIWFVICLTTCQYVLNACLANTIQFVACFFCIDKIYNKYVKLLVA